MNQSKNPQFCIIAPTAYLDHFAAQSSMHLVLAHLVDSDEEYANFYADRNEFKICDNGAFELGESYAPNKLMKLGRRCKANALVLPDYPFQPAEKTIEAAKERIDQFKDAGFNTVFVPQSEKGDIEDWIKGYVWAANNPSIDIIGMSILALPNAIPHIHTGYARVVLTQILIERGLFNYAKYHHYLGLTSGPALEIPSLIKMGVLDSCDSSGPVWSGINGIRYNVTTDSFCPMSKPFLREVNFQEPLTNKQNILEAIQYNIDLTLNIFK